MNPWQEYAQRLQDGFQPEKIILFGSFAWGNPTRDSDVDFLVIKKTKLGSTQRYMDACNAMMDEHSTVPVDVFVLTPEELEGRLAINDQFIRKICEKGITLYERKS